MRKALNEYGKSIRAKIGENKQGNSEMGNGKTYKQINKAEYALLEGTAFCAAGKCFG